MIKRTLTSAQKKVVAASFGWKCAACGELLPASFHVDHVVPLWDGGDDTLDNCQPLCPDHHADKTQREAIERAERKRRILRARVPVLECAGCGVICSPYFAHRCANIRKKNVGG
jgi:5-methylcytosine-specific restriction endonuclease McrA